MEDDRPDALGEGAADAGVNWPFEESQLRSLVAPANSDNECSKDAASPLSEGPSLRSEVVGVAMVFVPAVVRGSCGLRFRFADAAVLVQPVGNRAG